MSPEQEVEMKRGFSPPQPWVSSALLVSMLLLLATAALGQTPSIEGTYRLVSRTLRDGTVLKPPDVMGFRRSIVATYTLTPTEYIETTLFHILARGQEVRHDLSTQPQRSAVTTDAGHLRRPSRRS